MPTPTVCSRLAVSRSGPCPGRRASGTCIFLSTRHVAVMYAATFVTSRLSKRCRPGTTRDAERQTPKHYDTSRSRSQLDGFSGVNDLVAKLLVACAGALTHRTDRHCNIQTTLARPSIVLLLQRLQGRCNGLLTHAKKPPRSALPANLCPATMMVNAANTHLPQHRRIYLISHKAFKVSEVKPSCPHT